MSWRDQFPAFPEEELPCIPAHWTDMSWRNDACPSFAPPWSAEYQIYTDRAEPQDRENGADLPRFIILHESGEEVLRTGVWRAVLAWEYQHRIGYDPFADDAATSVEEVAQALADHWQASREARTINLYPADQRPQCPICGLPIDLPTFIGPDGIARLLEQTSDHDGPIYEGTCAKGHTGLYQPEEDEEGEEEA